MKNTKNTKKLSVKKITAVAVTTAMVGVTSAKGKVKFIRNKKAKKCQPNSHGK